ncbi:MAG TPA: ribosome small subunit-dependent GTPase A [Phycisphaerae bacterium]|nr:ribosome small subunit-dependent GTPase A [Phycisphaerae bacterium]
MARRKGKSERRIKDWHQRYSAGDEVKGAAAPRQRMSRRAVKLGAGSFAAAEADLEGMERKTGMVVGLFRGGATVRLEGRRLLCGIAKTFRAPGGTSPLAVGDDVTVALVPAGYMQGRTDTDKRRADGVILSRGPRKSALSRPQPWSGKRRVEYKTQVPEKVIAANMDVLLIVAATRQPRMRRALIDRFLIIAERGELKPLLAVNKIDLQPPDEGLLAEFSHLGLEIFRCSAVTGAGLAALAAALAGRRSVLAGPSGVGKSTLVNALVPGAEAATREIRMKDERGRHTTSAAVVYDLPAGGMIVDTPGIRELGMHIEAAVLPWYFPEFEAAAAKCRFKNCTHTAEPDCAVRDAAEAGAILPRRYESYLRILDTLEA